jgi:hypothetical protein
MKFKKFSISLVILICLLKIHTCQLFEQFNDEPSALEKNSKSLFDEPEQNLKPINSIFSSENSEKINNNAVPSIFGSVEDDLLKPIDTAKLQQTNKLSGIKQNNQNNKNKNNKNNNANKITKNISGPIKNLGNQANKKSTAETNKANSSGKFDFK